MPARESEQPSVPLLPALLSALFPRRDGSLAGGNPVAFYGFFSWCLTVLAVVTLVWPLNIPLIALAYKVRQGGQKIDMEAREFWTRSTFAALGLAVLSLVALGLTYLLVVGAELPRGQMHLVLLLAYLPVAVWFVFWIYALEDLLQGLSVFSLYILLPLLPLLLIGRLTPLWSIVRQAAPWLLPPTQGS
jgi:hypothetical protein